MQERGGGNTGKKGAYSYLFPSISLASLAHIFHFAIQSYRVSGTKEWEWRRVNH
jgi:hypothetical protein